MKRSLAMALALVAVVSVTRVGLAQAPTQCNDFLKLRNDAQQKAAAVHAATDHKAERKQICTLMQSFSAAEAAVVKFLEVNKTWCGIPDEAIKGAKLNHEKTVKFRTLACSDAPAGRPRQPTLSDAIGTPSVDTAGNTKTGRGTLDSLNGNPLAK
jgi:hypothetical protein